MKRFLFMMALTTLTVLSCSKDDEGPNGQQDPLIGAWQLRAIYNGEEVIEVTNEPCFQDTRFDVNENNLTLFISVPSGQPDASCQTESQSAAWENDGGTYYVITDGEREPLGISLNDDNQTLQLSITFDGEPFALIFRK
ncbi:lipocalin family protein [Parapedobacter lycopersici]|uniref:lipocalin family protein n=1 Tax=Parapedobacter lycopersici TaxID=1864939 RepID=UPI00333E648C